MGEGYSPPTGSVAAPGSWRIADFIFNEPASPTSTKATVLADVAPTLPLTIVMGVNDTFVLTPISTGTPETFTIAPGILTTIAQCATAMGVAIGSGTGEAFSTLITPTADATKILLTEVLPGASHNGDTITEGNGGAAALGFTGNPDTFAGGTSQTLTATFVVPAGATVGDIQPIGDSSTAWADGAGVTLTVSDVPYYNALSVGSFVYPTTSSGVIGTNWDSVNNSGNAYKGYAFSTCASYGPGPGVAYPLPYSDDRTITMTVSGIEIGGGGGQLLVRIIYLDAIEPVVAV